jgi:hypothetical protein
VTPVEVDDQTAFTAVILCGDSIAALTSPFPTR